MPLLHLPDELHSSTVKNAESEINVSALLQTFTRFYSKLSSYRYNVQKQGGYYGAELRDASGRGDEQMVKLLLDNGADVNTQGGLYGTALQAASNRGHKQILKLLLGKGADVNIQGGKLYGIKPTTVRSRDDNSTKYNKSGPCTLLGHPCTRHVRVFR